MNTHLITAEDHTLFLNCLQSILTSEKEYTVLLTNKRGKYVAQYLENAPGNDIKLISRATNQEKLEFLGNKNPIAEDTDSVIQYRAKGKDKVTTNTIENVNLTQREVEVITLVAKEFTTQEIADKLFLSKHTIESYRKNLISKLNVRNLAGLTKYALKMQYINLDTAL